MLWVEEVQSSAQSTEGTTVPDVNAHFCWRCSALHFIHSAHWFTFTEALELYQTPTCLESSELMIPMGQSGIKIFPFLLAFVSLKYRRYLGTSHDMKVFFTLHILT